jgi:signal transduction histidine kinase
MLQIQLQAQAPAHQLSQTIIQGLYQGVVILNRDGFVSYASTTAEMLLGYPSGDLYERHCDDFLDRSVCELMLISSGQTHRYTTILRHSDGHVVPAAITAQRLPHSTDDNYSLITIAALPSLGPLQETLMMEQRLASIGTLTTSIIHELTSPLSVISTTCENLQDCLQAEVVDKAKATEYVSMLRRNNERSSQLVSTLRSYARGGQNPQENNLNDIINSTLTMLAGQIRNKWGLHVITDLAPDLPPIWCDQHKIMQVLINLLSNARDAMQPHGGQIQVRSWAMPELNAVAFAVRDSGSGVPTEALDTIFAPFYTTKPKGAGTGLGLFITAEIVREHQGWIRVQNNPTSGATFTVILPVK